MGYLQEPPPTVQIAEARDELFRSMPAPKLALLRIISRNLADPQHDNQAKHFKLINAEAQGYVAAAQATRSSARVKEALVRAVALIDREILTSAAYNPFKITVAVGDDPLLGVPRDHDGVGPGQ